MTDGEFAALPLAGKRRVAHMRNTVLWYADIADGQAAGEIELGRIHDLTAGELEREYAATLKHRLAAKTATRRWPGSMTRDELEFTRAYLTERGYIFGDGVNQ